MNHKPCSELGGAHTGSGLPWLLMVDSFQGMGLLFFSPVLVCGSVPHTFCKCLFSFCLGFENIELSVMWSMF